MFRAVSRVGVVVFRDLASGMKAARMSRVGYSLGGTSLGLVTSLGLGASLAVASTTAQCVGNETKPKGEVWKWLKKVPAEKHGGPLGLQWLGAGCPKIYFQAIPNAMKLARHAAACCALPPAALEDPDSGGAYSNRATTAANLPRVVGFLAEIIDSGKQRGNHYEPLHRSEQAAILVVLATAELDAHDAATLGIASVIAVASHSLLYNGAPDDAAHDGSWGQRLLARTGLPAETFASDITYEPDDPIGLADFTAVIEFVVDTVHCKHSFISEALGDAKRPQLDITAQVVALCATIELFEYTTGKAPTITALVSQQSPLLGDWAGGGEHRWTHKARTHLILSLIGLRACRILRFASLAPDNPAAPPAPRTFNHPSAPLAVNPDALAEYAGTMTR
ncbi:hypothetical protein M885DRAFT_618968 [Pelagophyceae sp. CCMP2097]|nr:hypothetical protein M885DRAFT_618968 [Pelagophyceae sp. CCMP2097]